MRLKRRNLDKLAYYQGQILQWHSQRGRCDDKCQIPWFLSMVLGETK